MNTPPKKLRALATLLLMGLSTLALRAAEPAPAATVQPTPVAPVVRPQLTLPRVFSDNLVLQRERPVPVWGWAPSGEKVTVAFAGQTKTATADKEGKWTVTLDPLPEPAFVRYHFVDYPSGLHLYNRAGLPASPFRWDERKLY